MPRFRQGQLRHLTAVEVGFLQLVGQLVGGGTVRRQEQPAGPSRLSHPARGIEARRDTKPDIVGGEAIASQTRSFHQRGQTGTGAATQLLQANPGDDAILSQKGSHVRNRSDDGQIGKFPNGFRQAA